MVTIRPFEELDNTTSCKLAASIRNKLGVFARQHRFPFLAAWARECDPNGTGEHIHVLMHVPPRKFDKLERMVIGWFPAPGAADVSRRDQKVFVTSNGKQKSAIGYITKQMLPQACWRRPRIRRAGGPILGKRGGVTRNIGPAAIERYFRDCRAERPLNPTGMTGRLRRAEPSVPSMSMVKGSTARVSAGSDLRTVANGAHGRADANDPGNAPTVPTTILRTNSETTTNGADATCSPQSGPSERQPQQWRARI
jgi:hypothetical protein